MAEVVVEVVLEVVLRVVVEVVFEGARLAMVPLFRREPGGIERTTPREYPPIGLRGSSSRATPVRFTPGSGS